MEPASMDNPSSPATYSYRKGLEPIIEAGKFKVRGRRVLLRAILASDSSSLTVGVPYSVVDAECHAVVACGPEVSDIKPGQHVYCRSTAADRIRNDETSRYWLIDEQDVGAVWDPVATDDL
jgi:hypothetical protein